MTDYREMFGEKRIRMPQPADGGPATTDPATTEVDGGDGADLTPPAANNWWQFATKEDAESWANNLVTKRLSRDRKTNLEPLQQTNATLEAEVARLKPFEEAAMTEAEKRDAREAALQQELANLREFQAQTTRQATISEIADEVGLPASLRSFITADGNDADAVREQATTLLNAMSDGGSNTGKRKPPAQAPVPTDEGENGVGSKASGGGGGSDEKTDDELIAEIRERSAEIRKNGGLSFR